MKWRLFQEVETECTYIIKEGDFKLESFPGNEKTDKRYHCLSIVVPLFNETENVAPLLENIHTALNDYQYPWELIAVDDGSTDDTAVQLKMAREQYGKHIYIVLLKRSFGQTAAMQAGIDNARGDIMVTLDADLQNDPQDIPRMVKRLIDEDLDLLVGWRKNRKDNFFVRKIPSWLANRLISKTTGIVLHDYGCSLKVYRSAIMKNMRLYGDMHRFIPAWVATITSPSHIDEEVVNHRPRLMGKS